jgi:hypothetical protein
MPNDTQTQDAWVERVLGIAVPRGASTDQPTDDHTEQRRQARRVWRDARSDIDRKIAALQAACAHYESPQMQAIANADLLERFAPLLDAVDDSLGRPAVDAGEITAAGAKLITTLGRDPLAARLAANPLGVDAAIGAVAEAALRQIAVLFEPAKQ